MWRFWVGCYLACIAMLSALIESCAQGGRIKDSVAFDQSRIWTLEARTKGDAPIQSKTRDGNQVHVMCSSARPHTQKHSWTTHEKTPQQSLQHIPHLQIQFAQTFFGCNCTVNLIHINFPFKTPIPQDRKPYVQTKWERLWDADALGVWTFETCQQQTLQQTNQTPPKKVLPKILLGEPPHVKEVHLDPTLLIFNKEVPPQSVLAKGCVYTSSWTQCSEGVFFNTLIFVSFRNCDLLNLMSVRGSSSASAISPQGLCPNGNMMDKREKGLKFPATSHNSVSLVRCEGPCFKAKTKLWGGMGFPHTFSTSWKKADKVPLTPRYRSWGVRRCGGDPHLLTIVNPKLQHA